MNRSERGFAYLGLLILVGVAILVGGWGTQKFNRLVRLNEAVPAAWSQVEVVLQRRNDLIPNYVSSVKGYAKQEKVLYADISSALKAFGRAQSVSEKINADNTISGLLSRLTAVSLTYPKLQSSEHFGRLQDELAGTENRIAIERRRYNETVQAYNIEVRSFPGSVIARIAHFSANDAYYKADAAASTPTRVQF